MIRGLYTAASGMVTAMRRISAVTDNIANVGTTGFKQARTATMTFAELMLHEESASRGAGLLATTNPKLGQLGLSSVAEEPELDMTQGLLQSTGRALDLALEGPAFFVVETADGLRYTRDGSFTRDALGRLVTGDGGIALGESGPIVVPDGPVNVEPNGTIQANGEVVGQLKLVEFAPEQALRRLGDNYVTARDGTEPQPATASVVRQGQIEASNVDMTGAQTAMLELQRAYDANQRMIQYQDEMMGRAVNDVARPPM
jgi:flagellar basal-body rod protein FlgG